MTVRFNPTIVNAVLAGTFTEAYSSSLLFPNSLRLVKGIMPDSPATTLTAGNILDSGAVPLTVSSFSAVSNGRTDMISPLTIPIKSAVVSQVPSFIRIQNSSSVGMFDIDVNNIAGPSNAIINSMSVSTGDVVRLTDLRFIFKNTSSVSMTPGFYSSILRLIMGSPTAEGYSNKLLFGWPKVINSSSAETNAVLTIEAYDGDIPASSEDAATGTLLWKRTIPTTEASIFSVTGNIVNSARAHTSNALATGIPTYVRISKAAITAGTYVYPKLTMQFEVNKHLIFYNPKMTLGVSNTLDTFSFHMLTVT